MRKNRNKTTTTKKTTKFKNWSIFYVLVMVDLLEELFGEEALFIHTVAIAHWYTS